MMIMISSCEKAAQLSSKQLDFKLTLSEKFALNGHLFMCKTCTQYNNLMQVLNNVYSSISTQEAEDKHSLSETQKSNLKTQLKAQLNTNAEK